MNLRPAVFFPFCALGLAAAFYAGYALRGSSAEQGSVKPTAHLPVIRHVRNIAGDFGGTPFVAGKAEDWSRQMDDKASNLGGQRMRIYAAQQCALLDQDAAIDLISSCENHYHEWTCSSSEWAPDDMLLEELMRDAIVRLSDLNPARALEVAGDSDFLKSDEEAVVSCLESLVTNDPAKVAEFLEKSHCDVRELFQQLSRITDLRERPDILNQYLPVCRKDLPALGMLLDLYADHDRSGAFNTIASEISQGRDAANYDFANGLVFMDFSHREEFAEWSIDGSGPQAEQIQGQALQSLLPEMGSSPHHSRAIELFIETRQIK